jgi:hypothetical protein
MAYPATLKLIYDTKNFPASANCSACGEEMQGGELRTVFIGEKLRWFKGQFDFHRKQRHPLEDANLAAARIVRKATSIHIQ